METGESRRKVIQRRARPSRWGIFVKILLALLVCAGVGFAGWRYSSEVLALLPLDKWLGKAPPPKEAAPPPEKVRKSMTLYFAHPDATRLIAEERRMEPPADELLRVRRLLEELIRGPQTDAVPALPKKTRVRNVYFAGAGLVVVDLSSEVDELKPAGVGAELLATFAIVHTICENVESVKSVRLLVDGAEREALAGGVSLGEPLRPRPELVRRPTVN